jgi:dipeptidyl aminopeptidase/acylaminoacyl peptidase
MRRGARRGLARVGALLACALFVPALRAQTSAPPSVIETAFPLADGGSMRYAIALPADYRASSDDERPLVLALHPGGRDVYYGSWFMQSIVEPALRGWDAVIVAPDVPDESWATERSERAVLALLDAVLAEHAIDRDRILVTGFSMGGRGTWYLSARNPDRFTGVIVMATGPGRESLENLEHMPLYIIHSPDDEVVPYQPVEELAVQLAGRGYPVQMIRLPGATHGMMGDYVGPLRAAGEWMRTQWQADGSRER